MPRLSNANRSNTAWSCPPPLEPSSREPAAVLAAPSRSSSLAPRPHLVLADINTDGAAGDGAAVADTKPEPRAPTSSAATSRSSKDVQALAARGRPRRSPGQQRGRRQRRVASRRDAHRGLAVDIEIDLFGVIYGCHVFVPILRQQGHGHILNVLLGARDCFAAPEDGRLQRRQGRRRGAVGDAPRRAPGRRWASPCSARPSFERTSRATGRFRDDKSRKAAPSASCTAGRTRRTSPAPHWPRSNEASSTAFPMVDGRWFWRLKRLAPRKFGKLAGFVAERVMP